MTATRPTPGAWADIADHAAFARLVVEAPGLAFVAFEDHDCAHCREHRRLLQMSWRHLDPPLTTLLKTLRVDATRLPLLAQQYRIQGYPTLLLFHDGQLLDRVPGRPAPSEMLGRLERVLRTTPGLQRTPTPTGPGTEAGARGIDRDTIATATIPAHGRE